MRRHWKRFRVGDERTREFFAWWPVTVRNEHGAETRWLERVRVLEMFQQFKSCDRFWPKRFLDESNSNAGERTPPTLTDEETLAIKTAIVYLKEDPALPGIAEDKESLRGLLERLK